VRWELQALIERAGAPKRYIPIRKEISIIRVPYQISSEVNQPVAVTRLLANQADCRIVVLGRTFTIGSKIPVLPKIKLAEGIRCHSLSAYLMEQVDYFSVRKKEIRFGGRRHILYECQIEKQPTKSNKMSDDGLSRRGKPPQDARSAIKNHLDLELRTFNVSGKNMEA
jgi:arrestin-related trafficking adapter 3/6